MRVITFVILQVWRITGIHEEEVQLMLKTNLLVLCMYRSQNERVAKKGSEVPDKTCTIMEKMA